SHRQMMVPARHGGADDIDRRGYAVVRDVLDVVRAQVAQVDVPEAAEVEAVAALEVDAARLLRGQIDGRVDDRIARGNGRECRRIGRDERAELREALVAQVEGLLRLDSADRLVDIDLPVVDRGVESGQERRLQDHPDAGAGGLLRLQAEIAGLHDAIQHRLIAAKIIQDLAGAARPGLEQLTQIGRTDVPGAVGTQANVRGDIPGGADLP